MLSTHPARFTTHGALWLNAAKPDENDSLDYWCLPCRPFLLVDSYAGDSMVCRQSIHWKKGDCCWPGNPRHSRLQDRHNDYGHSELRIAHGQLAIIITYHR